MAIENRIGKVKSDKKGLLLDFDKAKIVNAIMEASKYVGGLHNNIDPDSIYVRFKEASEEEIANALTEDVILCLNMDRQYRSPHLPPTLEKIHDIVIDVLKDRGFVSVSSSYSLYREGQKSVRMGWLPKEKFVESGFPQKSYEKRKKWSQKHGLLTIEDLNKKIKEKKLAELVKIDSQRYEKELRDAVKKFEKEKEKRNLRVMIIAGPSSSGKTTTSEKLCKYLEARGYTFKLLTVDNYFFSTDEYPRDWFGDMNYELPESINLQKLNDDLKMLIAGKKVYTPVYDFQTGSISTSDKPMQLKKDEILLLDCLHGLYPPTTASIPDEYKFKVYIEPHTALVDTDGKAVKFTDIRMLRRMSRDVLSRGYSVQYTLEHWATVRKGEFKGIIPYFKTADVMINGTLIFNLPVLKYCLMKHIKQAFKKDVLDDYKKKGRMDAYRRGYRVKKLLEQVVMPTKAEISAIPKDNLIREFIGDL